MSHHLVFFLTGTDVEESSQVSMYSVMKAIKDSIQSPDDISFSFRSFPYYLSERLQHLLMCTATVYFRHQSFVSCVHNIDSLNRRILLTGPGGTSRCMAAVVASVAKDAGAHLMTFDWDLVTAEGEDDNEEDGGNGAGDEILDEFDFFEEFERRFANTGEVNASLLPSFRPKRPCLSLSRRISMWLSAIRENPRREAEAKCRLHATSSKNSWHQRKRRFPPRPKLSVKEIGWCSWATLQMPDNL